MLLVNLIPINEELIEEYIAEMPMMSTHVDTFIAIKVSEGKVDKADVVENALINYRANLVENSIQYPMNIAKVNASKVIRKGDYVFFIMLGKYDDREDVSEGQAIKFAKQETEAISKIILSNFN